MHRLRFLAVLLLFAGFAVRPAWAQEEEASLIEPPSLPKESIWLTEEEAPRQGFIVSEDEETMEFLEIVQRPGRRVSLVSRPIPISTMRLEQTVRLSDEEKDRLRDWIDQVRRRVEIEAGLIEAVELREQPGDGHTEYLYQGQWFTLESNADDETTRRCVVRIEQIFRAYRMNWPPQTEPATPLRIRLFGSMEAYDAYLAERGLQLNNPAFYSLRDNQIVAGGELSLFAENLAEVRQQNEVLRQQIDQREATLEDQLNSLAARLRGLGYSGEEIRRRLTISERAEREELSQMRQELQKAERLNTSSFNQLSDQMFRRLYHEALHAYIENYVFPHSFGEVPPWLNEGLALSFEIVQIEGERLRIDTPHPVALAQLRRDFESGSPLPLRSVILAESEDFHFHSIDDLEASRYYAYAWGLTWYLTMDLDPELRPGPALTLNQVKRQLNAPDETTSDADRIAHFEAIVGMPLHEFELNWREAMRAMW